MLNSKRDESIKRFLSKVGKLERKSKVFNSRYYVISDEIKVRFADHFSERKRKEKDELDIDIIKITGFYTLKVVKLGMAVTLEEDKIIPYLKCVLVLYPELNESLVVLKSAAKKFENEANLAKTELAQLKSKCNTELVNKANFEQLKLENSQLRSKSKKLEDQVTKIKTKAQALFDVARSLNMVGTD